MTEQKSGISRRGVLGGFAATGLLATPSISSASWLTGGNGDVRRIKMYSTRTGESIDMIYWIEGQYIKDALKEVNWFMRDWRQNKARNMDTRTIDVISASQRVLDTPKPFMLLSGYRTPQTNAMLRSRSRGVARKSLHMAGQAADLRMEGKSVGQIARAAVACGGGGVGRYSGSNFVHLDCGINRTWGR